MTYMTTQIIFTACVSGFIGSMAPTAAFLLLLHHHDRAVRKLGGEIEELKAKLQGAP